VLESHPLKKTDLEASVNFQNYKYILISKTYTVDLSLGIIKGFSLESGRTIFANSLDQEIEFVGFVPLGQLNGGDLHTTHTVGLSATDALEVHVVMVMICRRTGFAAEGVLGTALVVKHFVDKSFVKKRFQRAVNGNPIEFIADLFLYISM
jgi:hypothetical protein